MKTLEKGQDKIQKICDKIRRDTIEPAKQEAHTIIEEAQRKAEEILREAERQKEQLGIQAKAQIEQERKVFHSSLQQAAKQTIESLRQEIEQKFFNEELQTLLEKPLSDPKLLADLLNGIVKAIDKEGLSTDISIVSADDVTPLLLDGIRKRLKEKSVEVGHFSGGVQVKLIGKKMTLDVSDQALKELISNYVRKDFRQLLFG
jgi:V/A-type H+/Na+-transporting ATPase subunit E